ncbi:hypothetical protein LAT59_02570 [Candidatus Gracilibacteria bacterium]|nr:hypothetical protein [Candidatus Gracilibacteria bacterium]
MTKSWEKYIAKSQMREQLRGVIGDIENNNLDGYLVIPLTGYKDHYRIRKGKVRIVFKKLSDGNEIVAVDTRGQIYKVM